MRQVALYTRVSTDRQTTENQERELRRRVEGFVGHIVRRRHRMGGITARVTIADFGFCERRSESRARHRAKRFSGSAAPNEFPLVHPSGIEGLILGSWGYAIR
jgi:hypothetical protein